MLIQAEYLLIGYTIGVGYLTNQVQNFLTGCCFFVCKNLHRLLILRFNIVVCIYETHYLANYCNMRGIFFILGSYAILRQP